jgi:hypothetical protein
VLVFVADGAFGSMWELPTFVRPHGITIPGDGYVYLVDDFGCTVSKYSLGGEKVLDIRPSGGECSGTGAIWDERDQIERLRGIHSDGGPPFNHPTRVAVAPNGDIYVSDGYGNCKVHRFAADGSLIESWGSSGSGDGEFRLVHSVVLTPTGELAVADRENDRLQFFSLDGTFLTQWSNVHRPHQLKYSHDGLAFVGEARVKPGRYTFGNGESPDDKPAQISIHTVDGTVLGTVICEGSPRDPEGLAFDSFGNLYVSDAGTIRKYLRS